jgi:hypothetical protein
MVGLETKPYNPPNSDFSTIFWLRRLSHKSIFQDQNPFFSSTLHWIIPFRYPHVDFFFQTSMQKGCLNIQNQGLAPHFRIKLSIFPKEMSSTTGAKFSEKSTSGTLESY